jgi:hypothetical protein
LGNSRGPRHLTNAPRPSSKIGSARHPDPRPNPRDRDPPSRAGRTEQDPHQPYSRPRHPAFVEARSISPISPYGPVASAPWPSPAALDWLALAGLVVLVGFALAWLSVAFGLAAKRPDTASNLPLLLMILPLLSGGFVPIESLPGWLQGIAEYQPFTPIISTHPRPPRRHPQGKRCGMGGRLVHRDRRHRLRLVAVALPPPHRAVDDPHGRCRTTSDDVPDAPNEWRAQSTVIYTALIGTGIVMVQPYLTSTDLGTRLSSASPRYRSPILCSRRSCCSATTRTAAIVLAH